MKPYADKDGYQRIDCYYDGKQKHFKIHQMVYECWIGEIPPNKQINHYDDNKKNNCHFNLYCGSQQENIADCIRNGNRVGNKKKLVVKNKNTNEVLTFQPASDFLKYAKHTQANGGVSRVLTRQ